MKTVFITGTSTGIGYECAKIFMANGWNVVAAMRKPQNAPDALKQGNVLITKMDVTDADSIKNAVKEAISKFGQIDVLINNAGYYSIGVVEAILLHRFVLVELLYYWWKALILLAFYD